MLEMNDHVNSGHIHIGTFGSVSVCALRDIWGSPGSHFKEGNVLKLFAFLSVFWLLCVFCGFWHLSFVVFVGVGFGGFWLL